MFVSDVAVAFCRQNLENNTFSFLHVIRNFVLYFGGFNVCSGLFRSGGAFDMSTESNLLSFELGKREKHNEDKENERVWLEGARIRLR